MSENTTISAEQRERVGKGSARAVRRAGRVPAVIYGDKKDPLGITLETREITKIVHQPGIFGRLLDIHVAGGKHTVLTVIFSFIRCLIMSFIWIFSAYQARPKWLLLLLLNSSMKMNALESRLAAY